MPDAAYSRKAKRDDKYTYRRIVWEIERIRGHVSPVLNILERYADFFSNIPEWDQIEDFQLEMPELDMPNITNFNLVD